MKKLLSLLTSVILSFSLISCDELISHISHNVTVETFTSIWLLKDNPVQQALIKLENEFKDRVCFLKYYVDSTSDHPTPRLSCTEAEQRMKWCMQDKGLPTTFFDGVTYFKGLPPSSGSSEAAEAVYKTYKEIILKRLSEPPNIVIHANSEYIENKKTGTVTGKVLALKDLTDFKEMRLYFAIIEDEIQYDAINGVKNHKFVFRDFLSTENNEITDYLGTPMRIKGRDFGRKNDIFELTLDYEIKDIYNIKNLSIAMFVQDTATRNILNVTKLSINTEKAKTS